MDITSLLLFFAFTGITVYQEHTQQNQYHHECNALTWEHKERTLLLHTQIARLQKEQNIRTWALHECLNFPEDASCFLTRQCFGFEKKLDAFQIKRAIEKQQQQRRYKKKLTHHTPSRYKHKHR